MYSRLEAELIVETDNLRKLSSLLQKRVASMKKDLVQGRLDPCEFTDQIPNLVHQVFKVEEELNEKYRELALYN